MTIFCPECACENPDDSSLCGDCGASLELDALKDATPLRPMSWAAVGIMAGPQVVTALLSGALGFGLAKAAGLPQDAPQYSFVGGALAVAMPLIAAALGAVAVALRFRARYMREIVIGTAGAALLQTVMWLLPLVWGATAEGDMLRGNPFMYLLLSSAVTVTGALVFAYGAFAALEAITGKATCIGCKKTYGLKPKPPTLCPSCHAELHHSQVQWLWVAAAAGLSGCATLLFAWALGPALDFFYVCTGPDVTEGCTASGYAPGFVEFGQSYATTKVHVHQWTFWLITGFVMLPGPALLATLLHRGRRHSAAGGALAGPVAAAAAVALFIVARTGSDQLSQLLWLLFWAVLVWALYGTAGAALGFRIRARREQPALAPEDRISKTDALVLKDADIASEGKRIRQAQWQSRLAWAAAFAAVLAMGGLGALVCFGLMSEEGFLGGIRTKLWVGFVFGGFVSAAAVLKRLEPQEQLSEEEQLTDEEKAELGQYVGASKGVRRFTIMLAVGIGLPLFLSLSAIVVDAFFFGVASVAEAALTEEALGTTLADQRGRQLDEALDQLGVASERRHRRQGRTNDQGREQQGNAFNGTAQGGSSPGNLFGRSHRTSDASLSSSHGAVVAVSHSLYWIGGTTGSPDSLVRRFDVHQRRWESLPRAGVRRMSISGANIGNRIVVAGGMTGIARSTDAVEWYDVSTATWTRGSPLPGQVQRAALAAVDGTAYVFGGRRVLGFDRGDLDYESVSDAYAIGDDNVASIAPLPAPRESATAVVVEGRVFVIGGRVTRSGSDSSSGAPARAVDIYDPNTNTWTSAQPMPSGGAGCAVHVDGTIVFFEEHLNRKPNVYDIASNTWTRMNDRDRQYGLTVEGCGAIEGNIYVVTNTWQGILSPKIPLVVRYDIETDSWAHVSQREQASL